MRYSMFEQAAAEASYGVKEIEGQIAQLQAQLDQLKGKRDLLDSLSSQLLSVRPEGTGGGVAPTEFARPTNVAQMPRPEQPESQPGDDAGAARTLRQDWGSLGSDSGAKPSVDSLLRGRL